MSISVTTDYVRDTGNPEPYLRRISEAGFTHVHWCHQWNTDFLYSAPEISQIRAWLSDCGLQLLDLHGSDGVEKRWNSSAEYERLAGVELVRNRMQMTAELGSRVVVMHAGAPAAGKEEAFWRQLRRSLDALEPDARRLGVRLAIENGDWPTILAILADYPPDFVGICYDSGHGNRGKCTLEELAPAGNRLISVHLHDNDGTSDQHKIPFTGTVRWELLADIVAASSYTGCVNLEVSSRHFATMEETAFLAQTKAAGIKLTGMIQAAKTVRSHRDRAIGL